MSEAARRDKDSHKKPPHVVGSHVIIIVKMSLTFPRKASLSLRLVFWKVLRWDVWPTWNVGGNPEGPEKARRGWSLRCVHEASSLFTLLKYSLMLLLLLHRVYGGQLPSAAQWHQ